MVNLTEPKPATEGKETTPDPGMSILVFFIVTSVYCAISIFIGDSEKKLIIKVCYVLFIIIGQFFLNLNLTESMCGTRQWKNTLFLTIIPWVLIFVVLHLFLQIFPGWLTPFSNTFGYLVAKLMGLPDLMKEILVDKQPGTLSSALLSVSQDNSLLINELYPEPKTSIIDAKTGVKTYERTNYDDAWNKLVQGGIVKADNTDQGLINKEKLYRFVHMKYTISEYIWNLLTGFFVTSVSYNYIINTGCAKPPKEMQERYNAYQTKAKKEAEENNKKEANQPKYTQS